MVLKRPVAGAPVLVEDFGQPVYDELTRLTPLVPAPRVGGEFTWSGTATSSVNIPFNASNWASSGFAPAAQVNIPLAGIYGISFVAQYAGAPAGFTWIQVFKTPPGGAVVSAVFTGGATGQGSCVATLAINDKLSAQVGHGGTALQVSCQLTICRLAT